MATVAIATACFVICLCAAALSGVAVLYLAAAVCLGGGMYLAGA